MGTRLCVCVFNVQLEKPRVHDKCAWGYVYTRTAALDAVAPWEGEPRPGSGVRSAAGRARPGRAGPSEPAA